jgi:hypothetical protein
VLEKDGNIFGGFTPIPWEGCANWPFAKADLNLKTFIFSIINPNDYPPTKFYMKPDKGECAICCDIRWGPSFCGGFAIADQCDRNLRNECGNFGIVYENNTGLASSTFLTGSDYFIVKEIEVFEVIN